MMVKYFRVHRRRVRQLRSFSCRSQAANPGLKSRLFPTEEQNADPAISLFDALQIVRERQAASLILPALKCRFEAAL